MFRWLKNKRVRQALALVGIGLGIWFYQCLPNPLFNTPTSTILVDKNGRLLAGRIAKDGQWRFPKSDSVPYKFEQAILHFEDEYYYQHPGINPVSFARALKQNINAKRVVSGGSTLTMQTIRLARKGQSRSIGEKIVEVILALRLELSLSKKEILNLYASNAPFGGNVVGLDAAAWRYYGRRPEQLSWGEITVLAVLPNQPSLVYPGKNSEVLLRKRNRLLDKLEQNEVIDELTCELAKQEPLPGSPHAIPTVALHLLDRAIKNGKEGERVITTIDHHLQQQINRIVETGHTSLRQNNIHNMAVLVLDVKSGEVLAYVGNTNCKDEGSGSSVDVIMAPRSTGSILKPFLYSYMLEEGAILPKSLIPDIPTQIAGYAPKNFDRSYDGAVPADEALARSLNVPAVRMLMDYGTEKFHQRIQNLNLRHVNRSADHYGLSIILGGAESSLWDLSVAYTNMSRSLSGLTCIKDAKYTPSSESNELADNIFDPASTWWTVKAMSTLTRPWQEAGWTEFQSSSKIAWKTGTSFGHRDAWAIGFTPDFLVGVWVGNADGEGRAGLTGLNVAAPVMFNVFKRLPKGDWFDEPQLHMTSVEVCQESGYLASINCPNKKSIHVPENAERAKSCGYHRLVHLDSTAQNQVTAQCYPVAQMKNESWFVLPPVQEWYYRQKNPAYKPLPEFMPSCRNSQTASMDVIYPKNKSGIFIPRNLDGTMQKVVFEIAHHQPETTVYWHLDEKYLGATSADHRMELLAEAGNHLVTVVDEQGQGLTWQFEALEK